MLKSMLQTKSWSHGAYTPFFSGEPVRNREYLEGC